jgi:YfiH family protein
MMGEDTFTPSFVYPQWTAPSQVHTMVSTRKGGKSVAPYDSLNLGMHVGDLSVDVLANRAELAKYFPGEPLWLDQTHSTVVSTPAKRALSKKTPYAADAIVSNVPNEVLAIMTADCLPVLFASSGGTEVAAAHAGWRGLCSGILENTILELLILNPRLKPQDVIVWMGPAIGPTCFEVGEDVLVSFQSSGIPFPETAFKPISDKPGKFLADIYLLARSRLQAAGISQIYGGDLCTVSDSGQYFSYRRDGVTGRFGSFIWIEG